MGAIFRDKKKEKKIKWSKYNCNVSQTITSYRDPQDPSSSIVNDEQSLAIVGYNAFWSSYTFSTSSGFTKSGSHPSSATNAIGMYYIATTMVKQCTRVKADSSYAGGYRYYGKIVKTCSAVYTTTYSKGSTNYGYAYAKDGSLPESGTLIKGSATGDYCILKISSNYYYYERQS